MNGFQNSHIPANWTLPLLPFANRYDVLQQYMSLQEDSELTVLVLKV
jgi:hypothetical protein